MSAACLRASSRCLIVNGGACRRIVARRVAAPTLEITA
ncbi:hypothetical protein CFBP2533_20000 [Xanthomonas hortorum pv. pelargonii]|uniref:Uncharacterized protein n=1 Tax=Xanthomonas hortorum pv. pelargonii TaxID=453602 RepID=A0A6V7D6J8_9XANT|nr:hypothetical protein CFBP2533_20000 [Xanthomonas hortorum pv. pelargonii]CAD0327868.1 hypothetical protein CFBP2533_20000 [Xanthomonas hortorum pv. pelargonii]